MNIISKRPSVRRAIAMLNDPTHAQVRERIRQNIAYLRPNAQPSPGEVLLQCYQQNQIQHA